MEFEEEGAAGGLMVEAATVVEAAGAAVRAGAKAVVTMAAVLAKAGAGRAAALVNLATLVAGVRARDMKVEVMVTVALAHKIPAPSEAVE